MNRGAEWAISTAMDFLLRAAFTVAVWAPGLYCWFRYQERDETRWLAGLAAVAVIGIALNGYFYPRGPGDDCTRYSTHSDDICY